MKLLKYILGLALVAGGMMLTSCDQENEGAIYEPWAQNVSFTTASTKTITTSVDTVIPVHVRRSFTEGSYTANYVMTTDYAENFTDQNKGTVTFADGEGLAVVYVKAHNMEIGKSYTATLTLQDVKLSADTTFDNQNVSTVLNVFCDYVWTEAGACTFVDYTWEDGYASKENGVPIYHAAGTNIYKISQPLYYVYNGIYSNPSTADLTFYMDNNYNVTMPEGFWDMVYWGYYCYYTSTSYPDYCYVEKIEDSTYGSGYEVGFLITPDNASLYIGGIEFYPTWK